jgi:hypothetical protein
MRHSKTDACGQDHPQSCDYGGQAASLPSVKHPITLMV